VQFIVGKFTCEMSLDDDGKVVTRWDRSAEISNWSRAQPVSGGPQGIHGKPGGPTIDPLRSADAQHRRPRRKGQGKDSTTKTSIIFTVAIAALANGLISAATTA
jgi:hypothetical protein